MNTKGSFSTQRINDIEKYFQRAEILAKAKELTAESLQLLNAPDVTCKTKLTALKVQLSKINDQLLDLG